MVHTNTDSMLLVGRTSAGKSLFWLIPAVADTERQTVTVVIVPLRRLLAECSPRSFKTLPPCGPCIGPPLCLAPSATPSLSKRSHDTSLALAVPRACLSQQELLGGHTGRAD